MPKTKLTINIPESMRDDLQQRAQARGITVTELLRQAATLHRTLLADPANEIVLRNRETGKEAVVVVL